VFAPAVAAGYRSDPVFQASRADIRDTQIAGIALARRATIATRNLRHFSDLKVPVVDPWSAR
jgi:predicted nucleic acid-binding protein